MSYRPVPSRVPGHTVRWWVWADTAWGRVKIPRTATMRGPWGYDASCSCGWTTHTGGGTRRHIEDEVWLHRFEVGVE